MDVKVKRIGEALIDSGILSQDQLDILLDEQRHNPLMNLGEMAAKRFEIPIEQIESVFVDQIVLPSVRALLVKALAHELSPYVARTDFQIHDLCINMKIVQLEIARTVTSYFLANAPDAHHMMPTGKKASTKIQGNIELSITIMEGYEINPPDNTIQFTLDEGTGSIALEQCKLDGIKYVFRQAIKSKIGLPHDIDLIREEEMADLLNRYYNS